MDGDLAILLVEDNPFDAELIEGALKARLGCLVAVVASKEEFEIELNHHVPDLILSDSNLPSFSGMAAFHIAKERCPNIPVVFCSGGMTPTAKANALASGVSACVSKDDLDGLVTTVEHLAQKFKSPTDTGASE
jgi:CheY-like chemotaxis protein